VAVAASAVTIVSAGLAPAFAGGADQAKPVVGYRDSAPRSVASTRRSATCYADAVTARALTELEQFHGWLTANRATGTIGEVGWAGNRDTAAWNTLATTWLASARAKNLTAYAFAAAPWWPADHPLAFYRQRGSHAAPTVDTAGAQATTWEQALRQGLRGGVGLAEGSFGASVSDSGTYSAANPGVYGRAYTYPSAGTMAYLARRGVTSVRVAVMWERLQPTLRGPLSGAEVDRLRQVLRSAQAAGVKVVLDLHNYGRYAGVDARGRRTVLVLGSAQLTKEHLADVWVKLARAVRGERGLGGYGLMNEPHDLPGGAPAWEAISRHAVTQLRAVDPATAVYAAGYSWSAISTWASKHPTAWLANVPGPTVYEAHQYFDADRTGTYAASYPAANAAIAAAGWSRCGRG
jgi:hypothetical protein